MSLDEILKFFDRSCRPEEPVVWVGTIRDGSPHVVPVCFVKPFNGKLVIANNFITRTVKNILQGSRVSVSSVVRGESGFDGYMVVGRAEIEEKGDIFEMIKKEVETASGGRRSPRSAVIVTPEEVYSLKPGHGKKRLI